MLSKPIIEKLNEQINAEIESAYMYLSMSLDAESKNLPGIANWFYVQWKEELDHARIIQDYLNTQGSKVELKALGKVPSSWNSPIEMFEQAYEHECKITKMIHTITQEAAKEHDFATVSRMQWFIDEQVEEENSTLKIVDQLKMYQKEPIFIHNLDQELKTRHYVESKG